MVDGWWLSWLEFNHKVTPLIVTLFHLVESCQRKSTSQLSHNLKTTTKRHANIPATIAHRDATMTGQMMDGAPVARLQATDILCCCCCDAEDRHSICHWNGAEWGEASLLGLKPTPGWVRWAGICRGLGIPVVEAVRQCGTEIDQQDSETHGPDLSTPSGRKGKMLKRRLK